VPSSLRTEGLLFLFVGIGGLVKFFGAAANMSAHSRLELGLRLTAAIAASIAGIGLLRRRRWGATASVVWILAQVSDIVVTLASSIRERGMPHHSVGHWTLLALLFSVTLGSLGVIVASIWHRRSALA
jgi:hypothetical protein